jgi:hypothetical protein
MDLVLAKIQKWSVMMLAGMLVVVMVLPTIRLGELIGAEVRKPPRGLISVQGLLESLDTSSWD